MTDILYTSLLIYYHIEYQIKKVYSRIKNLFIYKEEEEKNIKIDKLLEI